MREFDVVSQVASCLKKIDGPCPRRAGATCTKSLRRLANLFSPSPLRLPSDRRMLDSFEILTTSGVVLWSKSYVPVSQSIINGLIKDVFIEEKVLTGANVADDESAARNPGYKKEVYTLKWTSVKDLGLIFVVRFLRAFYDNRRG